MLVIKFERSIFVIETMDIEPNMAFTRFTKLLIDLTQTSFFQTSNELKHVYLF